MHVTLTYNLQNRVTKISEFLKMNSDNTFHANYKIVEKIGEGSFSVILKCLHRATLIAYAGKRLKKRYKSITSVISSAEVVAAKKIPSHVNVLNMIEYHYDPFSGEVVFIFELMDKSLFERLLSKKCLNIKDKFDPISRGLSEQKAKEYLFQLLRGLEHLHKNGLFHRDIKPENILIKFHKNHMTNQTRYKNVEILKIADLGSIRGIYSEPPYTEYISTRWYRSPECLLTNGHYGSKMDIWSIGCVFYEMITLTPLFPGTCEIDQLDKIHQIVGSPTVQFLNKLKSRSTNCMIFPRIKGSGMDRLLPRISQQGRNILSYMIEYDPEKRSNVRRLINNHYFDDIRTKLETRLDDNKNLNQISCRSLDNANTLSTKDSISKNLKSKSLKGSFSSDSRRQCNYGNSKSIDKNNSKIPTPSTWTSYNNTSAKSKSNDKTSPMTNYRLDLQIQKPSISKKHILPNGSVKRSMKILG